MHGIPCRALLAVAALAGVMVAEATEVVPNWLVQVDKRMFGETYEEVLYEKVAACEVVEVEVVGGSNRFRVLCETAKEFLPCQVLYRRPHAPSLWHRLAHVEGL